MPLRQGQSPAPDERRAALDILYAEFVTMVWQAAEPFISHRPTGNQRPQPDWWDDECYQQLVSRNAACRERTANAREAFCRRRLQFHHLVRRKKVAFWSSWLRVQEGLSRSNPRAAARNVRAQLAPGRHGLPRSMRSPNVRATHNIWTTFGNVASRAAREAYVNQLWRCTLRQLQSTWGLR